VARQQQQRIVRILLHGRRGAGKSAVAAHAARAASAAFEKVVTADDCREDTHAALDTLRAAFDELHTKPQVCVYSLTVLSRAALPPAVRFAGRGDRNSAGAQTVAHA
jgi:Ni2+-binding GTPase involved in maturation of urease and hydrogenase